jgi:hypothetical protein
MESGMSFIVAGSALLLAVLASILLDVTDVERKQKAPGLLNLGSAWP